MPETTRHDTKMRSPMMSDMSAEIKLPNGGRVNAAVLRVKRLDDRAILPEYKSSQAAGLDLAACLPRHEFGEEVTIEPLQIVKIPLGYACAIPLGFEGQVRPRSGLSTKHGISLPNAPGTIDSDYRGEMFIALINLSREPYTIRHGDRIAQMVIAPVAHAAVREVRELDDTDRGDRGFGSTGLR
jgi:dUTP pyrophosphatase